MKNLNHLILTFLALVSFSLNSYGFDTKYTLELIKGNPDYYKTKFSNEQLNGIKGDPDNVGIKKDILNIFEQAWGEKSSSQKTHPGFKPKDLHKTFYNIIQSHYVGGYINKANFDNWNRNYRALFLKTPPTQLNQTQLKQFYLNQYKSVFTPYFSLLETSSMSCASEGDSVNNQKCCVGHVKVSVHRTLPYACKPMGNSCQSSSDCCSNICVTDGEGGPGTCAQESQCSRIRNLGESCDDINGYCKTGACVNQDISKVISNPSCKKQEFACTGNSECCSGLCQNNKCQESRMCDDCSSGGKVLKANETCCPGYLKIDNKCVLPVPKYVPTVMNSFKKNLLILSHILINSVFSSAMAMDQEGVNEAQQRLLNDKSQACKRITSKSAQERCLEKIGRHTEHYKNDTYLELTDDQTIGIMTQRERCTKQYETGTTGHKTCMGKVDETEKAMKAANKTRGQACANSNKVGTKEYKDCMVSAGLMGKRKNKETYVSDYGIPGVTAKTYSDPKSCEFNSYNDSWRDASDKERNAELFLRAFEYVFSYKGTEDYWFDKKAQNMSIFPRANRVSVQFRENRKIMLKKMQEIDKKMTCQCIAIFGPSKFEIVKQEFFEKNCEEEQAFLRAALGEDLKDINNKLDSGDSKIDGETSLGSDVVSDDQSPNPTQGTSSLKSDNAKVEEIDKGAIGLSHERLLVEWLNLRSEAQMDRFNTNSKLEKELQELSEFISKQDYFDVFKDKIVSKTFTRASSDPKYYGDTPNGKYIYRWGYSYRAGLIGAIQGFFGNGNSRGTGGNTYTANVTHVTKAGWQYHDSDKIYAYPETQDVKRISGKCIKRKLGMCYKKMDGYERWFLGPKFDNYSPLATNRCQTKGRASTCFKSGYKTSFADENAYVLDPTQPLFVDNGVISLNKMPGYAQTMPEMLNEARDAGLAYLISLKPRRHLKYGYMNGGKNFGKQNHMQMAISRGHFLPKGGKLVVHAIEDKNSKNSIDDQIKRAAIKYSMCKSLKECGAQGLADEEAIGLGYLFEEESEAVQFADYVYQIHWKWSHMTKESYMGYPLAGMDQYFSLVAYNMKLAGSLAASRAVKYAQAFQKFNSDFESRVGEYQSLGQAGVGTKSRNIKYSSAFYDTFELLNFSGETNLEKFDAAAVSSRNGVQFSSAETQALNNGRSSALRRNNDIKSKKKFEKALKGASASAKRAYAANKGFFDSINKPLNNISSKRLGGKKGSGGSGSKKFNAALSSINDKLNGLENANGNSTGNGYSNQGGGNFSMPSAFKFNSGGARSSGNYGNNAGGNGSAGGGIGTIGKNSNDSNMSSKQVNNLLEGLENSSKNFLPNDNDSLFKIVSKAYKRNYSRVLRRSMPKAKAIGNKGIKKPKMNSDTKNELKSLLE